MTSNEQALSWMNLQEPNKLYDPELMSFEQQREVLEKIYLYCYPWHNTRDQRFYDYPTFDQAVRHWASDEFYAQHLTAKLYCEALDWINE